MPKLIFKLVVSSIVFAIVLSRINIGAVAQAIGGADFLFLILALFLALAMVVTDAAFWQSVLGSLGHRISFGTALLYCIVGSFFGGFGLSWTGVDIFRAAQLRQSGILTETAIRAVVTARLVSLTSLLAVIACGLPIVLGYPLQLHDKVLLISFVVIGFGGLVAIVILGLAHNRYPLVGLPTFLSKAAGVSNDFFKALSSKRHSPTSLLFSTSTHLLRVSTFAAIAAALHAGVNFAALYALVPISLLVAMVPVALGSWGVREASVIFFLGLVGVPAATALSISVTYGILALIVDVIGGPVWVLARSHHYGITIKGASDNGAQASTERGILAGPRASVNAATVKRFAVIVPAYNASGTIVDCLEAILASTPKPSEVIVYHDGLTDNLSKVALSSNVRVIANRGAPVGPGRGRNVGSRELTCDVLIFVDADVIVAKDAFRLLLNEMEGDQQICAAFGSYDHTPRVTRLAALYTNLRHHWVHQTGQREAVTFWAGLGAVRREAFWAVGGFAEEPAVPKIEDIELGTRLKRECGRIRLVPEALGTHCKNWTIAQLWRTDVFHRAIPWARLLASGACVSGHLNDATQEHWSAAFAYLSLLTLAGSFLSVWSGIGFMVFALLYLILNRGLFQLLLRCGGVIALMAGVILHWIYHLYASAAYMIVRLYLLLPTKTGLPFQGGNALPMVPIAIDRAGSNRIGGH